MKARLDSKLTKKSQEYTRGTFANMQAVNPRQIHNVSAAGMPSSVVSNTSTRNMQMKVNNKLVQNPTDEDYSNRFTGARNSKNVNSLNNDKDFDKEATLMSSKAKRKNH